MNKPSWLRFPHPFSMGLVVLLATVVGIAFVLVGHRYGTASRYETELWIGILGIFATIGLALGIYVQAAQNKDLVDNAETQTAIIGESEVMPHVKEELGKKQFRFGQNRPWSTKIKIQLEDKTSEWIQHLAENVGTNWMVRLREDPIKDWMEEWEWGEYEGRLYLEYESITGGEYGFEFPIFVHLRESGDFAISAGDDVSRTLPWELGDEDG